MEDIREEGVEGLKGLNTRKGVEREISNRGQKESTTLQETEGFKKLSPKAFRQSYLQEESTRMEDPVQNVGAPGVGNSWYDRYLSSLSQLEDLEDLRANEQGFLNQLGAGITKAAVLAGTTFLEGTVGLAWSIGASIYNNSWNSFVNNTFSNAMQDINEFSEAALPNYYTAEQRDASWYDPVNLISANMLGDKLLKNTGFMVGAYFSGRAYSALGEGLVGLNKARDAFKGLAVAAKVTPQKYAALARGGKEALNTAQIISELGKDAKKLKHAGKTLQWVGNITGAIGESKIEAVGGVRERMQEAEQKINALEQEAQQEVIKEMEEAGISPITLQENGFGKMVYDIDPELKANFEDRVKAKFDKEATMARAQEEAEKQSNFVFLANLALLSLTNNVQFKNMFSKGYGTSRRLSNIKKIVKDGQISYTTNFSKLRTAKTIASTAFSEGVVEEMGQKMISAIPNSIMDKRMTSFIEGKTGEEANITVADRINAFILGFQDSYLNLDAWEEGFIGAVSASLGVPRFRKFRRKDGKIQSPIIYKGGTIGDIKEAIQRRRQATEQVETLNNLMKKERFINYFEGMVHHEHTEGLKNEAVKEGNKFAYHNAADSQIIGDLITADKAGRIDDYFEQLSYFENVTEQEIDEIKELFENKDDPNKSIFKGQSDEQIIRDIKDRASRYREIAENYMKLVEQVQIKYGDTLNQGALEEIIYYSNKAALLEDRFQDLGEKVLDKVKEADAVNPTMFTNMDTSTNEKVSTKDLTTSQKIERFFDHIKLDARYFTDKYGFKKKKRKVTLQEAAMEGPAFFVEALINSENKESLLAEILTIMPENEVNDFLENLTDLTSIGSLRTRYIDLLMRYENNPESLNKKMDSLEEDKKDKLKEEEDNILKTELKESESQEEFTSRVKNAQEQSEDPDNVENIIKDLEDEGDKQAAYYRKSRTYSHHINKEIDSQDVSDSHKASAKMIWESHVANSEDIETLSNPNSEALNDPRIIFDDVHLELTPEQEKELRTVQYAILNSMHTVNNSEQFAKELSDEYKEMNPKGEKNPLKEAGDFREDGRDRSTLPPINNPTKMAISDKKHSDIDTILDEVEKVDTGNSTEEFIENLEQKGYTLEPKFKSGPVYTIRKTLLDNKKNKRKKKLKEHKDEIFNKKKKVDYVDPTNLTPTEAKQAAKEFVEESEKAEKDSNPVNSERDKSKGWYTIIPEYELDRFKRDIFMKFPDAKALDGLDFSGIYNYLESKNAFKYVNEGKIKVGDEIKFVVDPKYQEIAGKDSRTQIFMAVEDSGKIQIVGALPNNTAVVERFLGLKNLSEEVDKGYRENPDSFYIHNKTVDVTQVLNGKLKYNTDLQGLREIPNMPENKDDVILAVVRNGQLVANNKEVPFVSPLSLEHKEGMIFMLVPNANGEYQPAAVVRERFSKEYYEEQKAHPDADSNSLLIRIEDLIRNISLVQDDTSAFEAKKEFQEIFYAPTIHINYVPASKNTPAQIVIKEDILDSEGNPYMETVMNSKGKSYERVSANRYTIDLTVGTEQKSLEDVQSEILDAMSALELSPQIDLNSINTPGYNEALINSGFLTSNLGHYGVLGSYFLTNYLDDSGNQQQADKFTNNYDEKRRKGKTILNSKEDIRDGIRVTVGNKSYFVDLNNDTIKTLDGQEINPSNKQDIMNVAHGLYLYSGIENSSDVYNGLAVLPDGNTVINLHTHSIIKGKLAQEAIDALDKRRRIIIGEMGYSLSYNKLRKSLDTAVNPNEKGKVIVPDPITKKTHEYEVIDSSKDKQSTDSEFEASKKEVQTLIEDFFTKDGAVTRPKNMPYKYFDFYVKSLIGFQEQIEADGGKILYLNSYMYSQDSSGKRKAGKPDIIIYNGEKKTMSIYNFNIYDSAANAPEGNIRILEEYADIFENMVGSEINSYGFYDFPIYVNRPNNKSDSKAKKTTPIKSSSQRIVKNNSRVYNKKEHNLRKKREEIRAKQGKKTKPVETNLRVEAKNDVSAKEHSFEGSKEGVFNAVNVIDGEVITTTTKAQMIDGPTKFGIKTKIARVPNYARDFNPDPVPRRKKLIGYDYYLVGENGQTLHTIGNTKLNVSLDSIVQEFQKALDKTTKEKLQKATQQANNITENFKEEQNKIQPKEAEEVKKSYADLENVYNKKDDNKIKSGRYSAKYTRQLSKKVNSFLEKFVSSLEVLTPEQKELIDTIVKDLEDNGSLAVIKKEAAKKVEQKTEGKQEESKEPTPEKETNEKSQEEDNTGSFINPDTGKVVKGTIVNEGYSLENLLDDAVQETTDDTYKKPDKFLFDLSSEETIEGTTEEDFDPDLLREVDDSIPYTPIDLVEEILWLQEVMPGFLQAGRLSIKKGLINMGSQSKEAWGLFKDGLVVLSDIAAEGTLYHEAFHVVFNSLLTTREAEQAYMEARDKYGDLSKQALEEKMAEEFREYVMGKKDQSLGAKILNFFKRLFAFVSNRKSLSPHLDALYKNINEGKYKESTFKAISSPLFEDTTTIDSPQNLESKLQHLKDTHYDTESKEVLSNRQKDLQISKVNHTFNDLSPELKNTLMEERVTETIYNELSLREKENLIICN